MVHTVQLHIYMAQFPLLPLLIPLCFPFVFPSTYLAPSSCDRNRPPPSQVACKLTLFAPPFTQLSHPLPIPRTPTAQRLTMTTSGIFRLLLSGTTMLHAHSACPCFMPMLQCYSNQCFMPMPGNAACSCYISYYNSVLDVHVSWLFAACPCCMSILHVHAACTCLMPMLHVHASCPCCMSMLHVLAAYLWYGNQRSEMK